MKAPENLVKAVERLDPQAILLLDANTIMEYPRLEKYEIAAPGPFLLVVPRVVIGEVLKISKRKRTDENKRHRALRTIRAMDDVLLPGVENGVKLPNGHLLITAETPTRPKFEDMSIEDHHAWTNEGEVDTALLRLADACAEYVPDTGVVLVTGDKDLKREAILKGVSVCTLSDLRSTKELRALLSNARPSSVASNDVDTNIDSTEKRPVKVALTLEQLDGEGEYLIAHGIGRLAYDGKAYPLRWTYRYKDAEKLDAASLFEMIGNTGDMPIERLDFMGENVEGIPDSVRRFACSMLEEAGWPDTWTQVTAGMLARTVTEKNLGSGWLDGSYSLQSPIARVRIAFAYMEAVNWGYYCCRDKLEWAWQPEGQDEETVDLFYDYFNRCEDLMNLTADNISTYFSTLADLYLDAFEMYRELTDKVGRLRVRTEQTPEEGLRMSIHRVPGKPKDDPESGLKWLLDVALNSWSIRQTREDEFTHSPYSI